MPAHTSTSLPANRRFPSYYQHIPGGPSIQSSSERMSSTVTPRTSGIPTRRSRNNDAQSLTESTPNNPSEDMVGDRIPSFRQSSATISNVRDLGVSNSVFVHVHGMPSIQPLDNHAMGTHDNIDPTGNYYGSITDTPRPFENSDYDMYRTYLLPKHRGIPLGQPGPPMDAPLEYRKKGISVGDVGVVDFTTGDFFFLFNIFRAANDEINEGRVPSGFTPLDLSEADIRRKIPYNRGSCVASSSVRLTDSSEFSFRTTGREGAVLVLPDGAVSEDLDLAGLRAVQDYIATNVEHWYEFIGGDSWGMSVKNGDIRVVTGTDKASSWGMATFEGVDVEDPIWFEFRDDGISSQVRSYKWHRIITGRAGPPEEEIQDLLEGPNPTAPRNQCIFLRAIKAIVPSKIQKELARQEVRASGYGDCIPDSSWPRVQSGRRKVNNPTPHTSDPSQSLTKHLLEKCPNAEVVITRDSDWISVITEDDAIARRFDEICARVLDSHIICEKQGVVTLEKTENHFITGSTSESSAIMDQQTTPEDERNQTPIDRFLEDDDSESDARRHNHAGGFFVNATGPRGAILGVQISDTGPVPSDSVRRVSRSLGGPAPLRNRYSRNSGVFDPPPGAASPHGGNDEGILLAFHGNVMGFVSNARHSGSIVAVSSSDIDPRQVTTPTPSEHSDYDIYHKYLSTKGRGTPLWVPGPQLMLPTEYRRKGVSIGDVGILDSRGDFAFLFNIFLPASHEINEGRVPSGFVPLDKSEVERTIKKSVVYERCIASSSLRRTDSSEFAFQTNGKEGAVLVMPDGAISEDLHNHKLMQRYIAANVESWYEFIERDNGMQAENGDIRLVMGTDKAASWGIAIFENANVDDPIRFELKEDGIISEVRTYRWDRITARAGPPAEEIRELSQGPNSSQLRNQCVFVRTLNISLSGASKNDPAGQEVRASPSRDYCIPDSSQHQEQSERNVNVRTLQPASHTLMFLNKLLLEKVTIRNSFQWAIEHDTAPWFKAISARPWLLPKKGKKADSAVSFRPRTHPSPMILIARKTTSKVLTEERLAVGTRDDIRRDLTEWTETIKRHPWFHRLNRPAGSGKTAIEKSLANRFRKATYQNMEEPLIATIPCQPMTSLPQTPHSMADAVDVSPTIFSKDLRAQKDPPILVKLYDLRLALETVTCALEIISRLVHHKTSPLGTFHFRRPEAHIRGAHQDEYHSEAQPPKPYLPLTETTRRSVYLNSAAESSLNSGENRRKAVIILNSFEWHLSFEALTTSFSNFGDLHDRLFFTI